MLLLISFSRGDRQIPPGHTSAIRLLKRSATLNELKEALSVRDTSNIGVYRKFV
jgi:hypothetical protein